MLESGFLEEFKQDFYNEVDTFIQNLEHNVLVLEKNPSDKEAINETFRIIHTLKGGAATLDFQRIANFAHEMENLLDHIRSLNIEINSELIDLFLKSIDIIKNLVSSTKKNKKISLDYEKNVIKEIKKMAKKKNENISDSILENNLIKKENKKNIIQKNDKIKNKVNLNINNILFEKLPKGFFLYEVIIKLNSDNPMKSINSFQIYSLLKEISSILKSIPNVNHLEKNIFYKELNFIIQSKYSSNKIYEKIYISDITDSVKIRQLKKSENNSLLTDKVIKKDEENFKITEIDLKSIENKLNEGLNVYKIIVEFDEKNSTKNANAKLFYQMIESRGQILKSFPNYDQLKNGIFHSSSKFILASKLEKNDLKEKLYISDFTKNLKLHVFKKEEEKNENKIKKLIQKEKVTEKEIKNNDNSINETKELINKNKNSKNSSLKVESSRIDDLLNLVGELVIAKASFTQMNEANEITFNHFIILLKQFKQQMRQSSSKINDFIEILNDFFKEKKISELNAEEIINFKEKIKEEFKEESISILGLFDSFFSNYKSIQEKLKGSSQILGRLINALQESVMKVRMVAISQIFNRFPRLVRDISRSLNKRIHLVMEGENTELDKVMIEDLIDPLVHIVRNALDHGIETSKERIKKGKSDKGKLILKAEYEGNNVLISVEDDGKGLDLNKIKQKAIQKKIIDSNQPMKKEEIINLIFHPGLTTVNEVTSLSGRGVGMDIVRSKIEKLSGAVQILTKKNSGSIFTIRLPLTLAIIQTLLLKVSYSIYSMPIVSVVETLRINRDKIEILKNTSIIRIRGEVLSLMYLDGLFKHPKLNNNEILYVVVVKSGNKKLALVVDDLVGEQDIVIKPLNDKYATVVGISGATILGDGQVSLVIDVAGIFDLIDNYLINN